MWKFQGHSDAAKIMYETEKEIKKTSCAAKEVDGEEDWQEVQNRKAGKKKRLAENELESRRGCDNSPLRTMTTCPSSGKIIRHGCSNSPLHATNDPAGQFESAGISLKPQI